MRIRGVALLALLLIVQLQTTSSPLAASAPLDGNAGLAGHWKLDETGGSAVSDASGFNNTGIVYGGAARTGGQMGGALQLDGVNDFVAVPHSDSTNIGGTQITLSAWIRFIPTGTWQTALVKVNGDNSHVAPYFTYLLGVTPSDEARFFLAIGGGTDFVDVRSRQRLVSGNWYHLAGVYDGVSLRIYVNGDLDGVRSETRSITTRWSSVRIGAGGTGNEPLRGSVDEVRIYRSALTGTDVSALADLESPSVPTGLSADTTSDAEVSLSWTASPDYNDIAGYRVYRDGTQVVDTLNTSYADFGLSPSTVYAYTAAAYDVAGNMSAQSTPVLATTAARPATGQVDIASGLAGHWEFDGTPVDSSGFNNTGTAQGGAVWANGRFGAALSLDGVNDYVAVPHSTSLNIGATEITLSAWILFASTGTWQTAVASTLR